VLMNLSSSMDLWKFSKCSNKMRNYMKMIKVVLPIAKSNQLEQECLLDKVVVPQE
jgi:hypothetical protein